MANPLDEQRTSNFNQDKSSLYPTPLSSAQTNINTYLNYKLIL